MNKKILATLSLGGNTLVASASELSNTDNLTAEQQEVINSFLNAKEQTQNNKMRAGYRASFKRGSALM